MRFSDPVTVECNFRMFATERGKIVRGSLREGHNVWTVTGRTYLAQSIAYSDYAALTPIRSDKVFYMGLGSGAQPEVASVEALANPVPYLTNQYMKPIQSAEFPTDPITSVAFNTEFLEGEISIGAGASVELREAGLYTENESGHVSDGLGAPVAYKNFEPLVKTTQFRLQVRWEIRFR